MGAIRGLLLIVVCVTLFLSLFVGGIVLTLSSSLSYENVRSGLVSFLGDVVNEQLDVEERLNQLVPEMEVYCKTNQQYTFVYGENIFMIPCDVATQGSNALVEHGVNSMVDKYYYEDYDCDFWDCFEEGEVPIFLISEKAKDYWQSKFYFTLLLSAGLAALAFLLVEKKSNFFLLVGSLTIVSSLPLIKINKIGSLFPSSFLDMGEYLSKIILIFFNESNSVFIKILIIGGVFVIVGIILKLFNIGIAISNFVSKFQKKDGKKDVKKIVQKEVSKKMVKEVKQVKQGKSTKQIKPIKQVKPIITKDNKAKKNKK